jgi:hypothetical protein
MYLYINGALIFSNDMHLLGYAIKKKGRVVNLPSNVWFLGRCNPQHHPYVMMLKTCYLTNLNHNVLVR